MSVKVANCDVTVAARHRLTTRFAAIAMSIINLKNSFYHNNSILIENIFEFKLISDLLELNTLLKR